MVKSSGPSSEFLAEAQEIVDNLNRDLIAAEAEARAGDVEPERINSLFRSAHSLKGISGMFGLDAVSRLAHEMESVLDGMRLGRVQLDAKALDVLFACVERFVELIAAVEAGAPDSPERLDDLLQRLGKVAGGGGSKSQHSLQDLVELGEDVVGVLTEYEEHRLRDNLVRGRNLYMLRSAFDLSNFDVGLAEIDAAVKKLGEIITKLPSSKAGEPGTIAFDIIVGSNAEMSDLARALADERVEVSPIRRRAPAATRGDPEPSDSTEPHEDGASPPTEEAATVKAASRTVRVDIRRLDRLMNLVGELSLTKMAYQRISEVLRRERGFTELAADLHKESRNFERRLTELQAGIMEVRMVPLANLFERMVRIGRKMSRQLGREVRIDVHGEHTELDKLIVEDLADPLMHLIRNAIDHGIEPPKVRAKLGKPREGVVRLSAAARGNHVVVEVADDGRGVDLAKTLEIAVARGIVTTERAAEMSRREIYSLLLMPGFSTKDQVTEYSGRGVGMDVVKTKISQLSGVLDIDSKTSEGTTISITLPITLAIIPALIVHVANRTYAIPLNNVQETLALDQRQIRTIERREVISVRGMTVPLADLREVFRIAGSERPKEAFAVIAGGGHSRMALVVDELVGQQDIVIKSLGRRLRQVPGIAGAAELGNQQTILVIDIVELLNEMSADDALAQEIA